MTVITIKRDNYKCMYFNLIPLLNHVPVSLLLNSLTELPTSTFLPYFVRFLKENTAVRFFLQKYVVCFFGFF